MGFALPALASLTHPLGAVARWLLPRAALRPIQVPTATMRPTGAVARILVPQPSPGAQTYAAPRPQLHGTASAARPVRVMLRTLEDGSARIVISGRMADVCAELDRLAPAVDRSRPRPAH